MLRCGGWRGAEKGVFHSPARRPMKDQRRENRAKWRKRRAGGEGREGPSFVERQRPGRDADDRAGCISISLCLPACVLAYVLFT